MPASPPVWDFDYQDDFLVVDGLEAVDLLRQRADGTYEAAVAVRAVRESPNKSRVAGQMEAADAVFHLFGPDVGAAGVRPGDRIADHAGAQWSVSGATLGGVLDQWRCPSIRVQV